MLLGLSTRASSSRRPKPSLLSRPHRLRGRGADRPLRPGLPQDLRGVDRQRLRQRGPRHSRSGCARSPKYLKPRGDGEGRISLGSWEGDHGDPQKAAGGAEGAAPGRQQVDRHRRAPRPSATAATTPKACAHRRAKPPQARDQGVGKAGVPQSRQQPGAGHPHHQGGAHAAAAASPARRPTNLDPRGHHRGHGPARLSRRRPAARASATR